MSEELKALNRQRYGDTADRYVVSPVHASGMGLPRLLELAEAEANWRVLDVATGGGHTALNFAAQVKEVIASDFTKGMLQAAQQFIEDQEVKNVKFCGADAEILPFAANSFDMVTCRVAAHHFPDIYSFVQEAYRVLKMDGVLLVHDHVVSENKQIADYVNAYEKLRDPAHARALPETEWRGLYLDAGFTIEHVEQFTFIHDIERWAKRQNCSDGTIERLNIMLLRAPDKVAEWMLPQYAGTDYACYTDHHIIIKGRKTDE